MPSWSSREPPTTTTTNQYTKYTKHTSHADALRCRRGCRECRRRRRRRPRASPGGKTWNCGRYRRASWSSREPTITTTNQYTPQNQSTGSLLDSSIDSAVWGVLDAQVDAPGGGAQIADRQGGLAGGAGGSSGRVVRTGSLDERAIGGHGRPRVVPIQMTTVPRKRKDHPPPAPRKKVRAD